MDLAAPTDPVFPYSRSALEVLIFEITYYRGILNGISQVINDRDRKDLEIEILLNEAVNTSEIEGSYLQRDSVRELHYIKSLVANLLL